jgi:hypothetical protein
MRDLVEVLGLVGTLLGLIPLLHERKRLVLATTLVLLIIFGGTYLGWEWHHEREEAKTKADLIRATKRQIGYRVCRSTDGLLFDQIKLPIDDEYDWEIADAALGELVKDESLIVETVNVSSWDEKVKDKIPVRIWRVKDPNFCVSVGASKQP